MEGMAERAAEHTVAFLPFFGKCLVVELNVFDDQEEEALIALGGPFGGHCACVWCWL